MRFSYLLTLCLVCGIVACASPRKELDENLHQLRKDVPELRAKAEEEEVIILAAMGKRELTASQREEIIAYLDEYNRTLDRFEQSLIKLEEISREDREARSRGKKDPSAQLQERRNMWQANHDLIVKDMEKLRKKTSEVFNILKAAPRKKKGS
jgi:hypothetical protein